MRRRFCSSVNGMSGPLFRVRPVPGRGIRALPVVVAILARAAGTLPWGRRRWRWPPAMAGLVSLGPARQELVSQLAVEGTEKEAEVLVAVRKTADLGSKVETPQLLYALRDPAAISCPPVARGLPQPGCELTGEGLHGRAVDDTAAPELVVPPSESAQLILGRLAALRYGARQVGQRGVHAIEDPQHLRSSRAVGGERFQARQGAPPARLRVEAHRPAEELLRMVVRVVLPDAQLVETAAQRVGVGTGGAADVDALSLYGQDGRDDVVAHTGQHAVQVEPERRAA